MNVMRCGLKIILVDFEIVGCMYWSCDQWIYKQNWNQLRLPRWHKVQNGDHSNHQLSLYWTRDLVPEADPSSRLSCWQTRSDIRDRVWRFGEQNPKAIRPIIYYLIRQSKWTGLQSCFGVVSQPPALMLPCDTATLAPVSTVQPHAKEVSNYHIHNSAVARADFAALMRRSHCCEISAVPKSFLVRRCRKHQVKRFIVCSSDYVGQNSRLGDSTTEWASHLIEFNSMDSCWKRRTIRFQGTRSYSVWSSGSRTGGRLPCTSSSI